MKKTINWLLMLFLLGISLTHAQEKSISGNVTDQDNIPLPGVNILVEGTTNGTQTDFDGNYAITGSEGQALIFSYIGQKSVRQVIGGSGTMNVTMEQDAEALEEVVVTAFGIKKEKRSVGYAVQEVEGEAIVKSGATNVVDALAGKSSGVQVTRASGSAGGGSRIVIRGATTMRGDNQALVVIDGVRSNNETINAQGNTAGTAQSNRLMDVNADDIESISVLKGAAATAVYGTAGSAGVIIITTKKGARGQKMRVNVSTQVAFDEVSQLTSLQDTYAQGRPLGGVPALRGPETGESGSWGPRLSDLEYSTDSSIYESVYGDYANAGNAFDNEGNYRWDNNGFLVPRGQGNGNPANNYNTLNSGDFFRTGLQMINNVGISGSTESMTYRFSASDLDQEGVVPNETYKRRTFNLGSTFQATEKLSFETALNYTRSDYNRIQQGSNTSGLLLGLYRTPASFDNSNGLGTAARDNPLGYEFADRSQRNYRGGGGYDNPYWVINNAPGIEEVHRLFGNFKINYNLNNWFNFGFNAGVDVTSDKRKQIFEVGSRTNPTGRILLDDFLTRQSDINLFVSGDGDLSDSFGFNYTVGANLFSFRRDRLNATGIGLLFPGFTDISNTTTVTSFEDVNRYRQMGIFANAAVDWDDTFYLSFSARQDYDSRLRNPAQEDFKASDISFFYPSVSGSLVFTELLPKNKVLTFGKIRASWAQVGAPPPTPYSTSTAYEIANVSGGWGNGVSFPINSITSFEQNNLAGDPGLTSELTTTKEYGIDLRFFGNRLNLDVAYFESDIQDAIVNASLAPSSGFTSKWVNAGLMSSKGWEVTLGFKPIVTEDFSWNSTLNWSTNETIVERLAPGIERIFLAGFQTAGSYLVEGLPYGAIVGGAYLREQAGTATDTSLSIPGGEIVINPATGYQDIDNTQRVIGDPTPDWILGWNNSISYKNWNLSFLLDWREGGDMWNGSAWALSFFGRSQLTADTREETPFVINGVLPDGSGGFTPNNIPVTRDRSYWTSNVGGFGSVGEQFVEDGGWIRLRELSLSYNFSKELFKNIPLIESANITFTGRNLWLDAPYDGVDPETSLTGNGNGQGFDYFNNPGTKSYMFKVGLNF